MTILAAILAFVVLIAPITSLISSGANVATAVDKVTVDIHTWRINGCPRRQFDGTVKYTCAKPAPKKKPVPQMAPQPPVYVPPPPPVVEAPAPVTEQTMKHVLVPLFDPEWAQWVLDHLFAGFIGLLAFGVIGHGLRKIYRIWKGYE